MLKNGALKKETREKTARLAMDAQKNGAAQMLRRTRAVAGWGRRWDSRVRGKLLDADHDAS